MQLRERKYAKHLDGRFAPKRAPRHGVRLVLLLGLACAGCKVTSEDIDTWEGTVKGPGKMVAVIMADKFEMPLRIHAALGLVEMERQDVEGVAELQQAVQNLDPETRTALIDGVVPGLVKLMQSGGEKAAGEDSGPPPAQIRAKDAAFLLISQAGEASRATLTDAVVGWYTEDFNGRSLSGNFSAEQVVRALGAPAAQKLVEALSAKLPQQALVKLSELIGQLGRDKTKAEAGKKLVAIEEEMRSPAFLKWLESEIGSQLAQGDKKPDPARVTAAAMLNRDKFINEGAIPAMKHLADQPVVANRLLKIAADTSPTMTARRVRALQALEGKARPEHLDALLALALDDKAPVQVRDYAFDRVGDIRDPKAIPPMWPLVQSANEQRLRWRAGELILAIGGSGVLAEFFAKLPDGAEYEPEELEGYATRMSQMTPLPRDVATAQLRSPDWWDQVIALRFFERKGTEADVKAMSRLSKSSTPVKGKGWGKTKSVGGVAAEAIAGLRERVKQAGDKGDAS